MLAAALWLPRSWLGFLVGSRDPDGSGGRVTQGQWLTLLPPPALAIHDPAADRPLDPDRPQPAALHQDPRWWQDGWAVRTVGDEALFAPTAPAADDTLLLLLSELGLGVDFMTRARPDSVLAARLFLLHVEDAFGYDELKPYLLQMGRAKDYADIMSRAADMYDEHLAQEIQVPD